MSDKRTNFNDVTETLAKAMEAADDMEYVVVLYSAKKELNRSGGIFTQDDVKCSEINWLFDCGKMWLLEDEE